MNLIKFAFLCSLLFLFWGCTQHADSEETPNQLLLDIADHRRFLSTDKVADLLINKDPSFKLVDVRSPEAFKTFALPRAINLPLNNTFLEKAQQLDCEKYSYIFYSNDDIYAEQAWMLNRRVGCQSAYVMKGGLNHWVETIMQPTAPPATASSKELDLYQFRKAASRYFAGGSREMKPEPFYQSTPQKAPKKVVKLSPKKVKKEVEEEEGC